MSLRDRTYVRLLGRPDSAGRSPWGGTDSASPAGLEAVEVAGLPGYPWAPPPGQHARDGSDPRPIQLPLMPMSGWVSKALITNNNADDRKIIRGHT